MAVVHPERLADRLTAKTSDNQFSQFPDFTSPPRRAERRPGSAAPPRRISPQTVAAVDETLSSSHGERGRTGIKALTRWTEEGIRDHLEIRTDLPTYAYI